MKALRIIGVSALAAAALFLPACGNSEKKPETVTNQDDKALAYVKCMREHGVQMPDPKPGERGFAVGGGGESQETIDAAMKACAKDMGGGQAGQGADQATLDMMVKYAQCMRANGWDMPDPTLSGGGVSAAMGPKNATEQAAFDKADKACAHVMTEGGK